MKFLIMKISLFSIYFLFLNQVKPKFSLCAPQGIWGSTGTHPLLLNCGISWMLLVSLAPLWTISRIQNAVALPGIEPHSVQSAACNPDIRYIDYIVAVPWTLFRAQYTCNINSLTQTCASIVKSLF
jgi:hypothetical protein